jgi:hypothetical protein
MIWSEFLCKFMLPNWRRLNDIKRSAEC